MTVTTPSAAPTSEPASEQSAGVPVRKVSALWVLIAYLVGSLINSTLAQQQRHVADAKRHSQEIEEMHKAFAAISGVARSVSLGTDARELVCEAVISSTAARLATVVEPRGGGFEITGSAGIPTDSVQLSDVQPDRLPRRAPHLLARRPGGAGRLAGHRRGDRHHLGAV